MIWKLCKNDYKVAMQQYRGYSSGVAEILSEIEGQPLRPKLKPKILPKDYAKENICRIRQIQSGKQRGEALKPLKADWKLDKYSHVPSKVTAFIQSDPPTPRPNSVNFLRAHSNTRTSSAPQTSIERRSRSLKKDGETQISTDNPNTLPAASTRQRPASLSRLGDLESGTEKSCTGIEDTKLKRFPSASSLNSKSDFNKPQKESHLGVVPKYLKERQRQLKEEEKRRKENQEAEEQRLLAKIVMPDAERLATLRMLQKSQEELTRQLSSLPVRVDTLRIRRQKEQLEQQLSKLEEGIKIFSKSKVYIKQDV